MMARSQAIITGIRNMVGSYLTAICDKDPALFIEHCRPCFAVGELPKNCRSNSLEGECALVVTVVGTSWMNVKAIRTGELLEEHGMVVRSIAPFDSRSIIESVKNSGHYIDVDNFLENFGFSAKAAAEVCAVSYKQLKSQVA